MYDSTTNIIYQYTYRQRQADVFIDAHGHAQIDNEINMLTL